MEVLDLVFALSSFALTLVLIYKISCMSKVFVANENLETIVIKKATETIASVYKENKRLRSEIKELSAENAVLNEKLVKITRQIDSFNKVFKQ